MHRLLNSTRDILNSIGQYETNRQIETDRFRCHRFRRENSYLSKSKIRIHIGLVDNMRKTSWTGERDSRTLRHILFVDKMKPTDKLKERGIRVVTDWLRVGEENYRLFQRDTGAHSIRREIKPTDTLKWKVIQEVIDFVRKMKTVGYTSKFVDRIKPIDMLKGGDI